MTGKSPLLDYSLMYDRIVSKSQIYRNSIFLLRVYTTNACRAG